MAFDNGNGYLYAANVQEGNLDVLSGVSLLGTIPVGFSFDSSPSAVVYDGGSGEVYVANRFSNDVSLISMESAYPVSFTESGLPTGMDWGVTLGSGEFNDSTTSSATVMAIDGTYTFRISTVAGYPSSPSSGTVTVDGAQDSIPITFTAVPAPGMYYLNFTENGLPAGTTWSVTVTGNFEDTTASSDTSVVAYSEWPGNYTYAVDPVPGFSANVSAGAVVIDNNVRTVLVSFTPEPTNSVPTPVVIASGATVGVVALAVVVLMRRRRTQARPPKEEVASADAKPTAPTGEPEGG